jgi:hypothetical protein
MTDTAELSILVKLRDEASAGLAQFGNAIEQNRQQIRQASTALLGLGAAMAGMISLSVLAADKNNNPLKDLADSAKDLSKAVGEAVIPVLRQLTDIIVPVIRSVTNWIEQHKTLVGILGTGLLVMGTLAVTLGTLGHLVVWITQLKLAWAAAQAILNAVMNLNPIFLLITLIAMLGAGIAGLIMSNNAASQSQSDLNNTFDIAAYRKQKLIELNEDLAKKTDKATLAIEAQKKALDNAYSKATDELADLIAKQERLNEIYGGVGIHILSGGQYDPSSKYYNGGYQPQETPSWTPPKGYGSFNFIPPLTWPSLKPEANLTPEVTNNFSFIIEGSVLSDEDFDRKILSGLLKLKDANGNIGLG